MTITGCVVIDLTCVKADRQGNRVHAALSDAPVGVEAELLVGTLPVDPAAVRLLREWAEVRHLTVKGDNHGAVVAWSEALRTGELCGMSL